MAYTAPIGASLQGCSLQFQLMFTVVAITDLRNVSFGTYTSRAEALAARDTVVECDDLIPDRCIDIVVHPGSIDSVKQSDYV